MSTQGTLTGEEADRVECEYYEGCKGDALYIAEILHYGEGEKPVRMCESCAEEQAEGEGYDFGDGIQRLKPADRYVSGSESDREPVYIVASAYADDPHPHIEGVFANRDEAEELMDDCQDKFGPPHPDAWTLYQAVPDGEMEVLRP